MRSATDSTRTHIPTKRKTKFPVEFKKETIDLIMQKQYPIICREIKRDIRDNRSAKLEREASKPTVASRVDVFKCYTLLKC